MRHYNSRKRVLVTGGAGFLGSHLGERSLAAGDVLCAETLLFDCHRQHQLGIKVRASSTPMARAGTPATAAWCPISSSRR